MVERAPIAVGMAIVGFFAGWGSALIAEWLRPADEPAVRGAGPLIKDPLMQGGSALVWGAAPLLLPEPWWRWLEAGLVSVPLIQVAVTDFRTHYVYTVVAAIGLILGLAFGWQIHGSEWWTSAAGALAGFVAFGVLYLLGRLIYRGKVEALAQGDITIAAMVGAGAAVCTAQALFVGVILGGVFAVAMLLARRSRYTFMPYGPGLCLGGLVTLFWC